MEKWHIKITLECPISKNKAIFEVNMNDKSANFNLNEYDTEKAKENPLLWKAFVDIVDMLWLREKFLQEMEHVIGRDE